YVDRAQDFVGQIGAQDTFVGIIAHVSAARLSLHANDPTEVKDRLALVMRNRSSVTVALPIDAVLVRLRAAELLLAVSESDARRFIHRLCLHVLAARPDLGSLNRSVEELGATLRSVTSAGRGSSP